MALTPEDVLNKNFTPTQFRRGYDEREVDDFLDEVVAEMRRLVKESDDLRDQLNECREGRGMAPVAKPDPQAEARRLAAAKDAKDAEEKAAHEAAEKLATIKARAEEAEKAAQERIAAATARAEQAEKAAQERLKAAAEQQSAAEQRAARAAEAAQAAPAPAPAPAAAEGGAASALGAAAAGGGASAASLIALAQRLHD
ncbi:MAG TPA: DivIVA domain-containing protein, partial [Pedococcus sp.]|nr:DivIVA domain-containing protein [Pedococcus sp.]